MEIIMLTDEQLKGKYIKYIPEITEEIFDRIIKKLIDVGFKAYGMNCDFEGFKRYGWLMIHNNCFQTGYIVIEYKEISYKDIIGEEKWWKDLKKGDYFVVIKSHRGYNGQLNHIYKAQKDGYYFKEYFKIPYETGGGNTIELQNINIRPATSDEIKMYEHAGKPVDVTTYKIPEKQSVSFQVHDKCNIGDIIVTTEVPKGVISRKVGDLHKVLEKSASTCLYYEKDTLIPKGFSNTYRLATPEEVKMYNDGIRNINDVKKEEDYKVGDAIIVIDPSTTPSCYLKKGKLYWVIATGADDGYGGPYCSCSLTKGGKREECGDIKFIGIRKATPEEIAKVTGEKDFVLPELWYIKVTEENKETLGKWRTSGRLCCDYGYCVNKVSTCRDVGYWYRDKPAGYVEITFEQFKKYVLKEESKEMTFYYGLKVGDVLPEQIICKWGNRDYNWICLSDTIPIWKRTGGFLKDRRIESFKEIEGKMTFLVSDTDKVYLNAEGFKAFMDSYIYSALLKVEVTPKKDPVEEVKLLVFDKVEILPNIKKEQIIKIKIEVNEQIEFVL